MPNRDGHRRFGNIRKRESGRFQIRYPGPDGRMRSGSNTYAGKSDAEKALTLIEAAMMAGEWTDPDGGKAKLSDYAATWIAERPGLRVRTVDLYSWHLARHIAPYLGAMPVGKLSTPMIRKWRADLLSDGVSESMAAKAYRLLRAVLTTAVEEDKISPRNPCRVRGAGEEHAAERPVLTVAQVFELADRIGRRPIGNIGKLPAAATRCAFAGTARCAPHPGVYSTRPDAERALWKMAEMAAPIAAMTGGFAPWCCSQPSRACGGVKLPRCHGLTSICKRGPCEYARRSLSGALTVRRSSSGRPSRGPDAGSSAFPRRSSRFWNSTCPSSSGRSLAHWCSAAYRACR